MWVPFEWLCLIIRGGQTIYPATIKIQRSGCFIAVFGFLFQFFNIIGIVVGSEIAAFKENSQTRYVPPPLSRLFHRGTNATVFSRFDRTGWIKNT